jgi:hypothetical protein
MNKTIRVGFSTGALLVTAVVPAQALQSGTAASAPPSKASEPPPTTDGRVIDPTFFIAIGVSLVIGFFIGRLTVGNRQAAH